jgi:hypothetical protein
MSLALVVRVIGARGSGEGRGFKICPSTAVAHDGGAYVKASVQQPLRGAPHPLRPFRGAYTVAAPSIVFAIAPDIAKGEITTPLVSAITRTARSLRRSFPRIAQRHTRRAKIKLGLTLSLPPIRQSRLRLPSRPRRAGQRQPCRPQAPAHRMNGAARRRPRPAAGQCSV